MKMNRKDDAMMARWLGVMALALSVFGPVGASAAQLGAQPHLVERHRKPGDLVSVAVQELPANVSTGPTSVKVVLTAAPSVSVLDLSYVVEGALQVDSAAPARVQLDAQHRAELQIPFTVLSSGMHYLHVQIKAAGQSTVFAVRVVAGVSAASGLQKPAARSLPPRSGGLVEMPAQESRTS